MSAGEVVAGAMMTIVVEFTLGRFVQLVVVHMTTNSNFLIEAGGERGHIRCYSSNSGQVFLAEVPHIHVEVASSHPLP